MKTVYVLYVIADPAELNTKIMGVYSTKGTAEAKRKQVKKRFAELNYRRFLSVRIDECELDV